MLWVPWVVWLSACKVDLTACASVVSSTPGGLPACACDGAVDHGGAVVVRWRVVDVPSGRLFSRGQCCCDPRGAATLCPQQKPSNCPVSPAWLMRNVVLEIYPAGRGAAVSGSTAPCAITTSCMDGELTTNLCLSEGDYDLQLSGELLMGLGNDVACAPATPVVPPMVRRTVRTGQITNLDGVVLGVNAPPTLDLSIAAGADAALGDGAASD